MENKENFSREKARKMVILYAVPIIFVISMIIVFIIKQANDDYRWWIFSGGTLILLLTSYIIGRFIHKKAKE